MKTKAIMFLLLLVISVATLLLALFGEDNNTLYAVLTVVCHASLVFFGYFYAKNQQATLFEALKKDILG